MIRLLVLLGMFLVLPNVFAESSIGAQQPKKLTEKSKKLDLTVPEKDLEYKPDTSKKVYVETKEQEAKRKKCADLSRRIDALQGKLRPTKRSTLINQHRAECQGRGEWQSSQ